MRQAHGWRAAVITATEAPQLPISALRMWRRTAREGEGQPRRTEWPPVAHPLLLRVSAARTPFPVQSPGAGAVPCTVANLPWGMRTPSPVPQHAFAYKVDRWLSSALGEVASSHRPGESFLIDHQCPLWGGRSALPHVDLPLPASLSSSSVSWGRRCGSSGQKITRKTVNLLMISTCENPAQTLGTLTHPTLPRSMHASRSHYEIRPIGPPLVGGGGGACSSRTSV
jgi:hypothetical protein